MIPPAPGRDPDPGNLNPAIASSKQAHCKIGVVTAQVDVDISARPHSAGESCLRA